MSGKQLSLSIVVPVYKAEKTLPILLESIESQNYGPFEVVLVNDDSPDDSLKISEEWAGKDPRIRVFSIENRGALAARIYGLKQTKNEVVLFYDADDSIPPHTFETISEKMQSSGADLLMYGMNRIVNGKAVEHPDIEKEELITDTNELFLRMLTGNTYNPMWRKAIRRELFPEDDYADYYSVVYGEDLIQSMEIVRNSKKALLIPERLYNYVLNPNGLTSTICYENYRPDYTVREYVLDFVRRHGIFDEGQMQIYRGYCMRLIFDQLKRISDFDAPPAGKLALMQTVYNSDYFQSFLKDASYDPRYLGKRELLIRLFENGHIRTVQRLMNLAVQLRRKKG